MSNDRNLTKMQTFVSDYHKERIIQIAEARKVSISRLIAFAIDNELLKHKPFEFDSSLPESADEYTFLDEAIKIATFMKTLKQGAGLDILLLLRHKIGIEDTVVFRHAFRELLDKKMIEAFKPPVKKGRKPHADSYMYYRVKETKNKKDKKYQEYLKLKKEFEGNL